MVSSSRLNGSRALLATLLPTFYRFLPKRIREVGVERGWPVAEAAREIFPLEASSDIPEISDPLVEILSSYPEDTWTFRFSESGIRSQWALRASGSCTNPKGAQIKVELYAPPVEAIHESGFVKVTVDTVCVYRHKWEGYLLPAGRSVREEVLRSPYWSWIKPRYEANLRFLQVARINNLNSEDAQSRVQYYSAIDKL